MITKKYWNSLDSSTRIKIIETLFPHSGSFNNLIYSDYNHDFDYNLEGRQLRTILSCCRLQSNGSIDVVNSIQPQIKKATPVSKTSIKKPQSKSSHLLSLGHEPTKYAVTYDDGDDCAHVWVTATSKEDAMDKVRREYWDVKNIISVSRM